MVLSFSEPCISLGKFPKKKNPKKKNTNGKTTLGVGFEPGTLECGISEQGGSAILRDLNNRELEYVPKRLETTETTDTAVRRVDKQPLKCLNGTLEWEWKLMF